MRRSDHLRTKCLSEIVTSAVRDLTRDGPKVVAEYSGHHRDPDMPVLMSATAFSKCYNAVAKYLSEHDYVGRFVGLGFTARSSSYLYLYPSMLAAFACKKIPFSVDMESQAADDVYETFQRIGLRTVICDSDYYDKVHRVTSCVSHYDVFKDEEHSGRLQTPSEQDSELFSELTGSDPAFLVQTSGTTKPNARTLILVTGRSFLPNFFDFFDEFDLNADSRVFAASPSTFDPFYLDLFLALCSSSLLHLSSPVCKANSDLFASRILQRSPPTFIQATPSLFNKIRGHFTEENAPKYMVLGGERFPNIDAGSFPAGTTFYNAYGVTEMSVWQSLVKVRDPSNDETPIAIVKGEEDKERRFCDMRLSDTAARLVINGQICARESTEEGEVAVYSSRRQCEQHPQVPDRDRPPNFEGMRGLYTGDLGVIRNGMLFFTRRRTDHHLKRSGKRFSLAEMSAAVEKILGPSRVHCCLIGDEISGEIQAFIAGGGEWDTDQAKLRCLASLPSHLVPNAFHIIEEFPITVNGKIDSDKLKRIATNASGRSSIPNDEVDLAALWQKYCGVPPVPDSNFLTDGGDSFKAVQLAGDVVGSWDGATEAPQLLEKLIGTTFKDVQEYLLHIKEKTYFEKNIPITNNSNHNDGKGRVLPIPKDATINLSAEGPKEQWRHHLFKCVDSAPLIVGRVDGGFTVFAGSHSGHFIAVDLQTGNLEWSVQFQDDPPKGENVGELKRRNRCRIEATASLSTDLKRVFVGCSNYYLYCLSATTGDILWKFPTGDALKCTPTVIHQLQKADRLIFPSYDRHLYCISAPEDGSEPSEVWRAGLLNSLCLARPLIAPDEPQTCFVATAKGDLISLRSETGAFRKVRSGLGGPIFGTPAFVNSILVVPVIIGGQSGADIVGIDPNPLDTLWTYRVKAPVFSSIVPTPPTDSGVALVFSCHGGKVHALTGDGGPVWQSEHRGKVTATPQIVRVDSASSVSAFGELAVLSMGNTSDVRLTDLSSGASTLLLDVGDSGKELTFAPAVACCERIVLGMRNDYIYCFQT